MFLTYLSCGYKVGGSSPPSLGQRLDEGGSQSFQEAFQHMARFSAWLPLPSRRLGSFALSFAGDAWDCVGDYSVADFEADPGEDFVDGPAEDFEGDPVVDFVYGPAAGFACALPVGCGH